MLHSHRKCTPKGIVLCWISVYDAFIPRLEVSVTLAWGGTRYEVSSFSWLLTVSLGLLGTGDELFAVKRRAEAQIVTRPNLAVVMIDELDKQSMKRR